MKDWGLVTTIETKQYFDEFQKTCEHWINTFGITSWRIYITNVEDGANQESLASTNLDVFAKMAFVNLTPIWESFPNNGIEDEIRFVAFHEIVHIFLADLIHAARTRAKDADLIEQFEHAIISQLWKLTGNTTCVIAKS